MTPIQIISYTAILDSDETGRVEGKPMNVSKICHTEEDIKTYRASIKDRISKKHTDSTIEILFMYKELNKTNSHVD